MAADDVPLTPGQWQFSSARSCTAAVAEWLIQNRVMKHQLLHHVADMFVHQSFRGSLIDPAILELVCIVEYLPHRESVFNALVHMLLDVAQIE